MSHYIAVSVLGKDRPGIVSSITETLFKTGCNIEDSSMVLIRNEFAMILIVEVLSKRSLPLLKKLLQQTAKKLKLSVLVRNISLKEERTGSLKGRQFMVSVYGADKPGIVYKISSFLSEKHINITDVQTAKKAKTYIMFLEIDIPRCVSAANVKSSLTKLALSMGINISINPLEVSKL